MLPMFSRTFAKSTAISSSVRGIFMEEASLTAEAIALARVNENSASVKTPEALAPSASDSIVISMFQVALGSGRTMTEAALGGR